MNLQIATLEEKQGKLQACVAGLQEDEQAADEPSERAEVRRKLKEKQKEVRSAESQVTVLRKQLVSTEQVAQKEDGPLMKELRRLERVLNLQITAWFGGTLNGNDTGAVFAARPFPVPYKLQSAVCPVCSRDFAASVTPSKRDPDADKRAMLAHLLAKHEGTDAHEKAKAKCADVLLRSVHEHHPRRSTVHVLTSLLGPRIVKDKNGVCKTVGCNMLMQRFRMLFGKFRQCRDLYRNATLCRHEVCKLVARTTSMGNCIPVRFPEMTITPKFMQLVVEFPRRAVKFKSVGDTTEQVIENFHATGKRWRKCYMSVRDKKQRTKLFMQKAHRHAFGEIKKRKRKTAGPRHGQMPAIVKARLSKVTPKICAAPIKPAIAGAPKAKQAGAPKRLSVTAAQQLSMQPTKALRVSAHNTPK